MKPEFTPSCPLLMVTAERAVDTILFIQQ